MCWIEGFRLLRRCTAVRSPAGFTQMTSIEEKYYMRLTSNLPRLNVDVVEEMMSECSRGTLWQIFHIVVLHVYSFFVFDSIWFWSSRFKLSFYFLPPKIIFFVNFWILHPFLFHKNLSIQVFLPWRDPRIRSDLKRCPRDPISWVGWSPRISKTENLKK